jgi:putative ABC transport system ATP-binding protein
MADPITLRGIHLTRTFGDGQSVSTAVDEVSLALHSGEFALLMGPSGSGKTTLLSMMSGLLHPTSGKVLSRDGDDLIDIWALDDREREKYRLHNCGYVFQGFNLFPALTARQQLEIVLRWGHGATSHEARKRSEQMLSLLGLGNKLNLLPAQLSGGEKQRVAIGRALVKNPTLCFADEPTSALDWAHGEQVVELLRNAAHERLGAMLVVSHDPRMVPFVDTVFHLEDGRLTDHDPVGHAPVGAH